MTGVSPLRPEQIDDVVTAEAPTVFEAIRRAAAGRNEAEFREDFYRAIADFADRVGLTLDRRAEYTVARGRADAVYNRLVIEYEPPRSLSARPGHGPTRHAVGQVKQYIEGIAERERRSTRRLVGVATDGAYLVFVRKWDTGWEEDAPAEIDEAQTKRLLRLLVSMAAGQALIAENLVADFARTRPTRGSWDRTCTEP